ncbi:MAG TPA: hypothetical protein VHY20_04385, partial [Pirellulales bacterium]|nr:hypothetical protein [Pirellulales bacterium]
MNASFLRQGLGAAIVAAIVWLAAWATPPAAACPFCTAPQPTLAERREAAEIVALVQWLATRANHEHMRVLKLLKSPQDSHPQQLELPAEAALRTSGMWLAFGRPSTSGDGALDWQTEAVNELSFAYVARLPPTRQPAHERLKYFCRYLESPDRLVADDVYAEFGRAPFDEVARLAADLPFESMRGWLHDAGVSELRKGFYAMALGLATGASDREANAKCLRKVLERPSSDFR